MENSHLLLYSLSLSGPWYFNTLHQPLWKIIVGIKVQERKRHLLWVSLIVEIWDVAFQRCIFASNQWKFFFFFFCIISYTPLFVEFALFFIFSLDCKLCLREILFLKKQKKKRLFNLEPYCNYEDIWMIGLYFILKWNSGIFKQRLCVHVFGCVNDKSTSQGSRIWWDFQIETLVLFFSFLKIRLPCKASKCFFRWAESGSFWGKQW